MPTLSRATVSLILVLGILACDTQQEPLAPKMPGILEIPSGFPGMNFPEDNAYSPERWALGKRLFFDPILSVDRTISCGHCHQQTMGFTDGLPVSTGVEGRIGRRNSPSLGNIGYHPYFTREGGVPTLEMQVLVPIQEHDEFDFNIVLAAERLMQDSSYVNQSRAAYNRDPDPFVITRALGNFERTLITGQSPYDQYLNDREAEVLSPAALRGMALFFSDRTSCSECHSGFNFTNYAFENNGLYEDYTDPGRFRLTSSELDRAKFKVPSLRNVGVSGPYMHDGSIGSLEAVVAHYSSGGKDHPNKSPLIRPLLLSGSEQRDLVAFLEALTDQNFLENPIFKAP